MLGGLAMQAYLVALCHFCEFHGPSLIMVTQSVRDNGLSRAADRTTEEQNSRLFGCQQLFGPTSQTGSRGSTPSPEPGCEGCWSLGGGQTDHFLVSQDKEARRSFVSSQQVVNHQMRGLLRQAVIRSISCETCPGREGPLLFSDPSVSTVLSNNFLLKDSKARGFQRYYSIIVLSREQEHLVANWAPLNQTVTQTVINPLKEKTSKNNKSLSDLKEKCEVLRDTFPRKRGSTKPARNLRELTKDQDIFTFLHSAFVHILAMIERRLKETVLSGQPMRSSVIFPRASLSLLLDVLAEVGTPSFKVILLHLLSGRRLQVRSSLRNLARKVAESLCILLPNNLGVNSGSCFANLLVSSQQVELEDSPQLRVEEESSGLKFKFLLPGCGCHSEAGVAPVHPCECCQQASIPTINSSFVTKFCRIFSNQNLPTTIQEMAIRSFDEKILLHSRVYQELKVVTEKKKFLSLNGFTASDEEILNFFRMFS